MYHWRNQFYGWLVGQKEKFFEDGQALRYTNPAPAYTIGIALAAGGYTYAPPRHAAHRPEPTSVRVFLDESVG